MVGVSRFERLVDVVMDHSKIAIVVMVLLSVAIGAGAPKVSEESSLDQFQTDSVAADKLEFIQEKFGTRDVDTTTAQIIVRGDNVLQKQTLIRIIEYEQRLKSRQVIEKTLVEDNSIVGVPNLVAVASMKAEEGKELQVLASELEREREAFEANRSALEQRSQQLNATAKDLQSALTVLRQNPNASVEAQWQTVVANTTVELDQQDFATFKQAASQLRNASSKQEAKQAYVLGTRGVLKEEFEALQERSQAVQAEGKQVQELGDRLKAQQAEFENASNATLAEQKAQLESMSQAEIDAIVERVLSADSGQRTLFLMPSDYEPGSTSADGTMLIVTQKTDSAGGPQGSASSAIVDSQLAMVDLDKPGGLQFAVFGGGVISHEISASQSDSLRIVSPLALIFVLLALIIAYRDLLDIILGLVGIATVLLWTFGFMGWTGIDFNQIFIAVPVLLIGLSIDYAIHIFMRHREERSAIGDGPRSGMRIALSGVGIALVWVTATTVIGFLSNLISPVGPIRDFGVVSSFGIVAALLVFGVLIPSLKVEIDEVLEGFGLDREKRAFGTGGGRFSRVLSVGAAGARRAPAVVILLALLVTAGGAYGATQVDTSFDQSDFLAEDPPQWMKDLPEPFKPGEYTAKANLELVNDNFVREDSQVQLLVEGDITRANTLERLADTRERATNKGVTQRLSNGEAAIRGPLSVMRQVAAENESFNGTFTAADTDGNGVPDQNLEVVYEEFYRVAPERAASIVYRTDSGNYQATRLIISIKGGAAGEAVDTQMNALAASLDGQGLTVTATGQTILNYLVQQDLLQTVIESLLVTLVAIVLFLMIAYRITEGSATLGLFTLLPVMLSVSWILGTMFLMGIPFNVLTGMITSLTVGLGVAYSIHLSERYNQELERTGSVQDAMTTATTGTGGALLGSAATTVGGFGVLVFAILPPLQQFGIITGLTIVYAFLAAVLVLPSLLVVWTRFFGPEDAPERAKQTVTVNDGDVTVSSNGESVQGSLEEGGFVPATSQDGDGRTAGTAGGDGHATGTVDGEGVTPTARRTIHFDHVHPGQPLDVDLQLSNVDGRVVLAEAFDGDVVEVPDATPEPVDVVSRGGALYVAWDATGDVSLTYRATVPEWATDEDEPLFSGRVLSEHGDTTVGGVQRLDVVSDLFERIVARGTVTEDDLQVAGDQLEAGELSAERFERIHRVWLRDATDVESADAFEIQEDE